MTSRYSNHKRNNNGISLPMSSRIKSYKRGPVDRKPVRRAISDAAAFLRTSQHKTIAFCTKTLLSNRPQIAADKAKATSKPGAIRHQHHRRVKDRKFLREQDSSSLRSKGARSYISDSSTVLSDFDSEFRHDKDSTLFATYSDSGGKVSTLRAAPQHASCAEAHSNDVDLFGEDNLIASAKRRSSSIDNSAIVRNFDDARDSIADCDNGCNGQVPKESTKTESYTIDTACKLQHFDRHEMLGQGAFGQVWLASVKSSNKESEVRSHPYALKIQSKHELVVSGQAKDAVREVEIMLDCKNHGSLLPLIKTFQDDKFLYMVLGYVPGGELEKRVHTKTTDGLPDSHAQFYAAGVLEALLFMHKKQIVYRDLKPENVLIDQNGYPVLIDFGLAKHVPDKTYTRCGSPHYMAPEVIKCGVGYDQSADYWSFGCLIHEMITGDPPFGGGYSTELALYTAICSGYLHAHPFFEEQNKTKTRDLVQRLLVVDPSERLGAVPGDIAQHSWFHYVDYCLLRKRQIPAPWIPIVENAFDTSNFEDMSDVQDVVTKSYPEVNEEKQALFSSLG